TLHSFFQLPFGPYLAGGDGYERNQQRQFRFSGEKKKIIRSLDLLVIDEISMVRADLLDAVDDVLRRYRRSELPFGGVQVLMIGDLHQLSPVARKNEWQLLEQHYASIYFFSSKVLSRTKLVTIELRHIYRQSDQRFISLLNRVRNNRLDKATLNELNRRYIKGFKQNKGEGYITLTTHNNSADSINRDQLEKLDTEEFCFNAEIIDEFPVNIYPTPAALRLKEGSQVMFVRNDLAAEKRYYNGKIGRISKISGDGINVLCPDDDQEITVEPVVWENIKYTLNQESGELEEDIVGSFEQYPLRLAWAITIHKSQGLTFEKAVIDAEAAFAHGQVYVALSRCKTFEGLVLSSPVASVGIATDSAVLSFDEQARQNPPSEDKLQNAKISYQQQLLLTCFDMRTLRKQLGYLVHLLLGNSRVVQIMGGADLDELEDQAVQDIFLVSENFITQLRNIFAEGNLPESDPHIQERTRKASAWFQEKFKLIFSESIPQLHIDTDNKELGKKTTRH
ncbi:MAG: helicase, partial [Candidatus Electrothrix sp. AR4]|nr:helicase [Candidatus Electrothrix sp. AR4]